MKLNPMLLLGGLAALMLMGKKSEAAKQGVVIGEGGGQAPPKPDGTPGKVLPPLPPLGVGLTPGSTFMYAGQPGMSILSLPPMDSPGMTAGQPPAKGADDYIAQLWAREQAYKKSTVRPAYSVPRNKAMARSAAAYYGVPASWVYGILQGESNYFPVGIHAGYKGSPAKAMSINDTGYGMGQITRSRWKGEWPKLVALSGGGWAGVQVDPYDIEATPSTTGIKLEHWHMLDPKVGIWATAASYGRMVANRGGGPGKTLEDQVIGIQKAARGVGSNIKRKDGTVFKQGSLAVGNWWAGTYSIKGARAKVRQIIRYGGDVWDNDMRPKTSWKKTEPGVQPTDYLPPWRTGSLTPTQHNEMMQRLSVLEAAGQELRDLNPDIK